MTETKSPQEPAALPVKRKSDLTSQDHDHQQNLPHKSPKIQTLDEAVPPNEQNHALITSGTNVSSSVLESIPEIGDTGIDSEEEPDDEDDDYGDEDDDNDDEEEEEDNGSTPVDRKGKGILIEEVNDSDDEDDDDEDDSSDEGNESEGDSDLSDDPLAEVDLDNILPSRTRRRVVHSGVRIAKDGGNKSQADDNDDGDS